MIDTLKSVSTIVITWLGIVLTVFFAYYTFKFQLRTSTTKDQLYKAYLPMFKMLEPYLYKDVEEIGIDNLEKLISDVQTLCYEHYELVEPQIISYIIRIKENLQQPDFDRTLANEQYKRICAKVDFEFERCRKRLNLPTRGPYYRLNHKHYENKLVFSYNFFLIVWKGIAFIIISGILAIPLSTVLANILKFWLTK